MYNVERQRQIMSILSERKRCTVKELSVMLYTSEATIRRDLAVLAGEGKLQKVFGGALLFEQYAEEVPFAVRRDDRTEVKRLICRSAASLLREGMTVFMDASTTPEHLVPYLKELHHLQIVTNNPRLPLLLADTSLEVYSTGGRLSHSSQSLVGCMAEDAVARMNADLYFFSARGVSEDGRITDSAQNECRIKQRMLANAAVSCFLCDSEKTGHAYMCTVALCSEVDYVFSDVPLGEPLLGKRQK